MNIKGIIKLCGGHSAIAERSHSTTTPVGVAAVRKWDRCGVRVVHWPMIISMSGTNPDELYKAHLEL